MRDAFSAVANRFLTEHIGWSDVYDPQSLVPYVSSDTRRPCVTLYAAHTTPTRMALRNIFQIP